MADAVPDEAVFWSIKREVLQEMREELVRNIMPDKFFSYLRSKGVFDIDDCDIINSEKTRRKKAECFLDILETKGPEGFRHFCDFIRENKTQLYLVKKIMDLFEEKIKDVRVPVKFDEQLLPQSPEDDDKEKPLTVVSVSTPLPTPSLVIPPMSSGVLPGPPTPPDESSSNTFTLPSSSSSNDTTTTTLTGNSVSQTTSPDDSYPGPSLPPYSSEPVPSSPPPSYDQITNN